MALVCKKSRSRLWWVRSVIERSCSGVEKLSAHSADPRERIAIHSIGIKFESGSRFAIVGFAWKFT